MKKPQSKKSAAIAKDADKPTHKPTPAEAIKAYFAAKGSHISRRGWKRTVAELGEPADNRRG